MTRNRFVRSCKPEAPACDRKENPPSERGGEKTRSAVPFCAHENFKISSGGFRGGKKIKDLLPGKLKEEENPIRPRHGRGVVTNGKGRNFIYWGIEEGIRGKSFLIPYPAVTAKGVPQTRE